MSTVTDTQYPESVTPEMQHVFDDGMAQDSSEIVMVYNPIPWDKMTFPMLPLGGAGLFSAEDFHTEEEMPDMDIREGYKVEATLQSYRGKIPVAGGTWETMGDHQRNSMIKSMGQSGARSQSYMMGAFMANAFTTSKTGDTKAICANDHPLKGVAGTYDNSYALALTADNVAIICSHLRMLPTDQGIAGLYVPRYLVVHSQKKKLAMEIAYGNGPGTTTNDLFWRETGLVVVINDETDDVDDWFVLAENENGFVFPFQQALYLEMDYEKKSDKWYLLGQYRAAVACGTARCIIGNSL